MTWLIRLYPPAWRRRYGRELAELLAMQPASFRAAIDLVAGAIDAWLAVSWIVPLLFSQRYTDLKGRSGRAQAVLIVGPAAIVLAIVLAVVWINNN